MADVDDGGAPFTKAAQMTHEPLDLGRRQATRRLVEDEHSRVTRNARGDLDELSLCRRQVQAPIESGHRRADRGKGVFGLRLHRGVLDPESSATTTQPGDVLGDAQIGKKLDLLVNHDDACVAGVPGAVEGDRLAFEGQRAGVGAHQAGKNTKQCAFSGAILADECVDATGMQRQADADEGGSAGVTLRDVGQLDNGGHRRSKGLVWGQATGNNL